MIRAVMHQRADLVGADVDAASAAVGVGLEVARFARLDVRPVDRDVAVTVGAGLGVPQPDGVADLVDGVSRRAGARELHRLGTADAADAG